MNPFPHDIFTEPSDVDPDTLANLGPLRRLAGRWEAHKGIDINPKADAPERRVFIERIAFDAIDPQANGPQLFYGLRYHVHITTQEEDITFHEQVGYWLWEPATGLILQTLAIPRGQVALASGQAKVGDDKLTLTATPRADRIWHLFDRLPRIWLSHRQLSDRRHVRGRGCLEIRYPHDAGGPWPRRAVRAPGPEPAEARCAGQAQSAAADPGAAGEAAAGTIIGRGRESARKQTSNSSVRD
jgi:hypothetical protein